LLEIWCSGSWFSVHNLNTWELITCLESGCAAQCPPFFVALCSCSMHPGLECQGPFVPYAELLLDFEQSSLKICWNQILVAPLSVHLGITGAKSYCLCGAELSTQ
jgi:hypothetical protein